MRRIVLYQLSRARTPQSSYQRARREEARHRVAVEEGHDQRDAPAAGLGCPELNLQVVAQGNPEACLGRATPRAQGATIRATTKMDVDANNAMRGAQPDRSE